MFAEIRQVITDLQADYEHISHHVADPDGPDEIRFQKSISEQATA